MRTLSTECALSFLLITAFGTGCASPRVAERGPSAGAPVESTYWTLVEVDGRPVRGAGTGTEPYLQLDPVQKQARGETGCNRFFGPYELSGDALHFGPLASTRRACLDPEMSRQERAFLDALSATRTWQVAGDTLVLLGETGPLARFAARHRPSAQRS